MRYSLLSLVLLLLLAACSDGCAVFKPYDYDKKEKAKVEFPKVKSSVDVERHQLLIKRKYSFP